MPDASAARAPGPTTSVDAKRLGRLYQILRSNPKHHEARLHLAQKLIQAGRHDLALRHARRLAKWVGPSWPRYERLGNLLFRLGQFDLAHDYLDGALKRQAPTAEALRTFATLRQRRGNAASAYRNLVMASMIEPVTGPNRPDPDKPTILRVRSLENSHYGIARNADGLFTRRVSGGHFALEVLMDFSRYNIYAANMIGKNLLYDAEVPPFDLLFNNTTCPDLNPYGIRHVCKFVERFRDMPIINDPVKVLETSRLRNYERLSPLAGVRFPRTVLVTNDAPPPSVTDRIEGLDFGYPLIIRRPGTQAGVSVVRLDTKTQLTSHLEATLPGEDLYVIEYLDCRDKKGLYGKRRVFFIDGMLFPVNYIISNTWQIHGRDRYRIMAQQRSLHEREKAFMRDPKQDLGADAFSALYRIAEIIDLDFFGIDFTVTEDGDLIVFEVNSSMKHTFIHTETFPYTRPYLMSISTAFNNMIETKIGVC